MELERQSEAASGDSVPAPAQTSREQEAAAEAEERARLERYDHVLLTSSSILAGFAMTGLLGLPEVGKEGIERLSASIFFEPADLTFVILFYAMLVATICFLGVMVTLVSGRLQGRRRSLHALRSTFRASVLVFGVGLSALFCATVTIGVPTHLGFLVGLGGGMAIALTLFVRAMRQQ